MDKADYLKYQLVKDYGLLKQDTPPRFGKMNVHQMIEHMTYAFEQAAGKIILPQANDAETTEKMYRFMMSDKPFRENTPNPYLPETPAATISADIATALVNLQSAIDTFFRVFDGHDDHRIENPFFGNLNKEEWIHLLHKHSQHHLRQFTTSS